MGGILGWQCIHSISSEQKTRWWRFFVPNIFPLTTCVAGTFRVPFLPLWVCQGSGTSRRSGRGAGERCRLTIELSKPVSLQSAVSGAESVGVLGGGVPLTTCWVWTGMLTPLGSRWGWSRQVFGSLIKGWLPVLDWPQGFTSRFWFVRTLDLTFDHTWKKGLPVQGFMLQPFCSSSGLYQDVCFGIGLGLQEGDLALVLSGWLVGDYRTNSYLVSTSQVAPSVTQGPGHCLGHGEARPWSYQRGLVSWDAHAPSKIESSWWTLNCHMSGIGEQVLSSRSSSC